MALISQRTMSKMRNAKKAVETGTLKKMRSNVPNATLGREFMRKVWRIHRASQIVAS